MPHRLYTDLQWLPRAPADWRDRLSKASSRSDAAAIAALAQFALDGSQLTRLARALTRVERAAWTDAGFSPFRLGIVGTGTLDLVVPMIEASALRHGIHLECVTAGYGQAMQQALDPGSTLNTSSCDAVLMAIDHADLPLVRPHGPGVPGSGVGASIAMLDQLRDGFMANAGCPVILQTIAHAPETLFGHFDAREQSTARAQITAINRALVDSLEGSCDLVLDVAALAETVGLAMWRDPSAWHLAKLPFAAQCAPLYAEHVARLVGAIRGKSRRCLVLDLDNTLWGGVIGDDGQDGIRLGQGDPLGEAFAEFQWTCLALHNRGIVLAVSSKNDDAIARAVFRDHPEMILREEHIAVFQANWSDKARNLEAIARELSLGLSSLVLVDDNPAERALVRSLAPAVAVPELPADPALYSRTIGAAGYFEALTFSAEDRQRGAFFRANARRAQLQATAGSLDGYLESLGMVITLGSFEGVHRERIVQLINKSNQFNLTTRRYDAPAIAALEVAGEGATLQVRLRDVFGDNGLIGVVIALPGQGSGSDQHDAWEIDTWLMSCRVLGRRVEEVVLDQLCRRARAAGKRRLIGRFIPSGRNDLVRDHYARLGFSLLATHEDGSTSWVLMTDAERPALPPMTIESHP